jgi:hypothetical protein
VAGEVLDRAVLPLVAAVAAEAPAAVTARRALARWWRRQAKWRAKLPPARQRRRTAAEGAEAADEAAAEEAARQEGALLSPEAEAGQVGEAAARADSTMRPWR